MNTPDLSKIIRKNIQQLTAYSSARDEFKGKASVYLDANENSFGSAAGNGFNRYPDPLQQELKQKIAGIKKVNSNRIFLGNGSDEPIDLLIRACCEPGIDNILIFQPTYGMYTVAAQINNVAIKEVMLTADFQLDIPGINAAIDAQTKLLFICSPNNPTGNLIDENDLFELLKTFTGLVILDEAYIDFSPGKSMLQRLDEFPNLVILQTFSKAWGMAALRLGMAFASIEIIQVLNKIKAPYNISSLVQQEALKAFENIEKVRDWTVTIIAEQLNLEAALAQFSFVQKVYHSDANFLLIKVDDAASLYDYLLQKEIVVRSRTKLPLCENTLRITVGTKIENQQLLNAFENYKA